MARLLIELGGTSLPPVAEYYLHIHQGGHKYWKRGINSPEITHQTIFKLFIVNYQSHNLSLINMYF